MTVLAVAARHRQPPAQGPCRRCQGHRRPQRESLRRCKPGGCRKTRNLARIIAREGRRHRIPEALAQAESEGSDVGQVLAAHEATLEALLKDEFTRMLKRRTMYLLGLVAVSLVIGILGNLLFVMTGGGSVLGQIGG